MLDPFLKVAGSLLGNREVGGSELHFSPRAAVVIESARVPSMLTDRVAPAAMQAVAPAELST